MKAATLPTNPPGKAAVTTESNTNHRRDVMTAKFVLHAIDRRRNPRVESAHDKVLGMFAALDMILTQMPEDAPDSDLEEIERIVTTLRTADQSFSQGGSSSGMQSLELARARIERLALRIRPEEPE